jgi:ferric enterobactin receptor
MKRIGGLLLIPLLLAAASQGAAAQNAPPAGARPGMPGPGMQQEGGTIRGIVRGPDGAPLRAAQVGVWSAADSSLVTGAVVGQDGSFRIEGLRPGQYYLRVSLLGYTTGTVPTVSLTPQQRVADVGEVRLQTNAVQLAAIEASTERSAVETAVDRNVYNTRELPSAAGGNATDVLRNVPAIEVDGDGKVSLRGNENVAIQINGRPAPLRGDALTNFLKQLPANMVERVEVVPNPSAKYDPDGMGGIINIVLKQNTELGLSGGLTVGAGTGGRYNGSGNLGWQKGPLTLFGSYGLLRDERANEAFNDRVSLDSLTSAPLGYVNQVTDGEFGVTSHTFNGSADLKLGAQNTLSSSLMFSLRDLGIENGNTFVERDASRDELRRFREVSRLGLDNTTFDGSLAFRRIMTPQRHEISGEVRFNQSDDTDRNRYLTYLFSGGVPQNEPSSLRSNDLDARTREWTFQTDYTRALSGAVKLEAGYKGTLRSLENDYLERLTGGPITDRAYAFTYDEDVHAGYGLLTGTLGRLSLQGGLRLEEARTTFDLDADSAYDNRYTSLFPSAAATWQVDDQRQVRASYSRRIQRPHTQLLNPFPFQEDQFNRIEGNPRLDPEYTDSWELNYQQSTQWGSIQLSPYFRRTTDAVRRFKRVETDPEDPSRSISVVTFRNLATSDAYGADFTTALRLGRVNGFASFSGFRVVSDGSNVESGLGTDAFTWSARASLSYKLTPRTDVQWFQFYRAPMEVEQGRIGSFSIANFSVRHKVMGEKGTLSLRVSDPFDQMGFRFQTGDRFHEQDSRRKFGARAVFLTFSYNFGQTPRLRQQRQPQEPQAPQPEIGIN